MELNNFIKMKKYVLLFFLVTNIYIDGSKFVSASVNSDKPPTNDSLRFYIYIQELHAGDRFYDNNTSQDYFYRILISSQGEHRSIHVELLRIPPDGEDIIYLDKSIEVLPRLFDVDWYSALPTFIEWMSPYEVKLFINGDEKELDLRSLNLFDNIL